jgi:hypothetical protein
MRASPRRRFSGAGAARVGVALLAVCAGLTAGAALAGSSIEARAVAAARQAASRAEVRAQVLNSFAGATAPRPRPVAAKAAVPAVRVPAAAVAPVKAGTPTVRAPQGVARTPGAPAPRRIAAVAASMHPAMTTVPASPPAARLDDQVTYQYNALGRRDPFSPLVGGAEFVPIEAPPDVGALRVVGIVWGSQDKFAIIEDGRGNSTVLRPGDRVMNGIVQGLTREGIVVSLTVDGQTQSVTIPLTRKGDSNANR